MTSTETRLLGNVLDALDRLFDRDSRPIDIHALVEATGEALGDTQHYAILNAAAEALERGIRSGGTMEDQRDFALNVTDDLRHYLADLLPFERGGEP